MRKSLNIKYAIIGDFDEKIIDYIEELVEGKLELHHSLYKGEYWLFRKEDPELNIELRINLDPMHDPNSDPKEECYFDYENKDCVLLLAIVGDPKTVSEISSKMSINTSFRKVENENSW